MLEKTTQFMCPFYYYMMRYPYLASQTTYRQIPNLNGVWCGYNPTVPFMGTARISQQGNNLTFFSEGGGRSNGRFLNKNTVIATDWNNLYGTITPDLSAIKWHNNTTWTRGNCDCSNIRVQTPKQLSVKATEAMNGNYRVYICFKPQSGYQNGWYFVGSVSSTDLACALTVVKDGSSDTFVIDCENIRAII